MTRRFSRLRIGAMAVLAILAALILPASAAHATGTVGFVALGSNSSGASGGSSPISVTLNPWIVGAHDEIVIIVTETASKTLTTPAGYTAGPASSEVSGGTTLIYRQFFYKTAVGGDSGSTVTITPSGSTRWAVSAEVFSNADYDSSAYAGSAGVSSNEPYANVNPYGTDLVLVSLGVAESSTNGTNCGTSGPCYNLSPNSGGYDAYWTSEASPNTARSSASNVATADFWTKGPSGNGVPAGTTTSTGKSNCSSGDNDGYLSLTVALKPYA